MIPRAAAIVATMLTLASPCLAAGDAAHGKELFQRCSTCHSLTAGQNGVGPTLHGIFGSKAGDVPGYNFSKAMASSGIVWSEATLKKYLSDPDASVPGTKMRTGAVDDPQAVDDLIAYLQQAAR